MRIEKNELGNKQEKWIDSNYKQKRFTILRILAKEIKATKLK